mmetsp:Transcript_49324/g.127227  ORF Transcript_49324/g.127227 Transcript_49324/m.127227 type:complete len:200 (+) Transcript_49324:1332-1931(+)
MGVHQTEADVFNLHAKLVDAVVQTAGWVCLTGILAVEETLEDGHAILAGLVMLDRGLLPIFGEHSLALGLVHEHLEHVEQAMEDTGTLLLAPLHGCEEQALDLLHSLSGKFGDSARKRLDNALDAEADEVLCVLVLEHLQGRDILSFLIARGLVVVVMPSLAVHAHPNTRRRMGDARGAAAVPLWLNVGRLLNVQAHGV